MSIRNLLFGSLAAATLCLPVAAYAEQSKKEAPANNAAPGAAPAAATAPSSDQPLSDDQLMLQAISAMENVTAAKEKSVRAKVAVTDLNAQAAYVDFAPGGSLVSVVHHNELPSAYVLVGATYSLDGNPLYSKVDDSGELNLVGEEMVFNSRVMPGQHKLAVQFDLRGNSYGLLSYLEDIRLTLRQTYNFAVDPRKVTNISATVYSTGSLTRQYKDRPDVTFVQTVSRERESDRANAEIKPLDTPAGAGVPASAH